MAPESNRSLREAAAFIDSAVLLPYIPAAPAKSPPSRAAPSGEAAPPDQMNLSELKEMKILALAKLAKELNIEA
ncbi:MAG TPA: hypothetical protein VFA79_10745, partial [Myxococcales bacterium]|nr:hypothetical protein [Myxococcales bacterium]